MQGKKHDIEMSRGFGGLVEVGETTEFDGRVPANSRGAPPPHAVGWLLWRDMGGWEWDWFLGAGVAMSSNG